MGEDTSSSVAVAAANEASLVESSVSSAATADFVKEEKLSEAAVIRELKDTIDDLNKTRVREQEATKDLKAQLKKAQNDLKEIKLLLDMYKTCTKEQREKAQIMVRTLCCS